MSGIVKFFAIGCLLSGIVINEASARTKPRLLSATVQSLSTRAYHQASVELASDRVIVQLHNGGRLVLITDSLNTGDEEIVGRDRSGKFWAIYVDWTDEPSAPVLRRELPAPPATTVPTT